MSAPRPVDSVERLAEFERALQYHDWRFDYSDDPSVYHRGYDSQQRLEAMRRSLIADGLKAEADALWSRYSPYGASA